MPTELAWTFPLPRTHTGIPLGNALTGVLVWGEGSTLRLTLGRADLWDHRGGDTWSSKQTYSAIRRRLEAGDEAGLKKLFEEKTQPGQPRRPSIIPVGRIELDFGSEARLVEAELDMRRGLVTVELSSGKTRRRLKLALHPEAQVLAVKLPKGLHPTIRPVPAWETLQDPLSSIGFKAPTHYEDEGVHGWTQPMPADPALNVAWRRDGAELLIATARDGKTKAAKAARRILDEFDAKAVRKASARWWKQYARRIPQVEIPNPVLQELYDLGMYKFGAMTNPAGVPAGLQGPWIEEYQMPPWSADYHFNINVQMCYWPAYKAGLPEHIAPLFRMISGWEKTLRDNARKFVGVDGVLLPHAVDDRCVIQGGFWTGTIDHACTAWVADMMWQHYRHTLDSAFLREIAYPFMVGAMRVYEAMLEKKGNRLSLPVSVSPEYRGAAMNAWGRNASFQLAAIHRLTEDLTAAADILGEAPDPFWQEIRQKLPKATLIEGDAYPRIALWENTPLEESHRHHSHMAALTPFDIIEPDDPDWREVIRHTHNQWVQRGPGMWSGWCIPWASMLQTVLGNADMAELHLEILARVFVNEGRGTLHDANISGYTMMGPPPPGQIGKNPEIMQMDAGMGAVRAIQDMLLLDRRGLHHLFRGCPGRWRDVSFSGMHTDGGFVISAERRDGRVGEVRVESPFGGVFHLVNPWHDECDTITVRGRGGLRRSVSGDVLSIQTHPGERLTLLPPRMKD